MRKILAAATVLGMTLTPVFALPQRDRDDQGDRDEHRGRRERDDDERHDRGKHKGWSQGKGNPHRRQGSANQAQNSQQSGSSTSTQNQSSSSSK